MAYLNDFPDKLVGHGDATASLVSEFLGSHKADPLFTF